MKEEISSDHITTSNKRQASWAELGRLLNLPLVDFISLWLAHSISPLATLSPQIGQVSRSEIWRGKFTVLWRNEIVSFVLNTPVARRAEKLNSNGLSPPQALLDWRDPPEPHQTLAPRSERHHGNKKKTVGFPDLLCACWKGNFEGRNFSVPFFPD